MEKDCNELPEIDFSCPFCGQNLNSPGDMGGQIINCPVCNKQFQIPGGTIEPPISQPFPTFMTPIGGEKVLAVARPSGFYFTGQIPLRNPVFSLRNCGWQNSISLGGMGGARRCVRCHLPVVDNGDDAPLHLFLSQCHDKPSRCFQKRSCFNFHSRGADCRHPRCQPPSRPLGTPIECWVDCNCFSGNGRHRNLFFRYQKPAGYAGLD